MLLVFLFLLVAAAILGVVCFRAAEWCLNRRLRFLVYLVLVILGVGTIYGVLRLTGVVVLPDDNTWSVNFFDSSWRDEGVRRLVTWGGPFAGTAAALVWNWKKPAGPSLDSKLNEKS